MARVCVFCGGSGLTREHVLAQWLSAAMPRAGARLDVNYDHASNQARRWTTTVFDVVTKRVCARCNNGWMSALEAAAQPILMPMIQEARRAVITPEGVATVAAWAVKTAITFLATENEPTALIAAPAQWLVEAHQAQPYTWQPPPCAYVWLAARGIDERAAFARTHIKLLERGVSIPLLTLGVGYLVVQAALPMREGSPIMVPFEDTRDWVRIWPNYHWWPPPAGPRADGEFIELPEITS